MRNITFFFPTAISPALHSVCALGSQPIPGVFDDAPQRCRCGLHLESRGLLTLLKTSKRIQTRNSHSDTKRSFRITLVVYERSRARAHISKPGRVPRKRGGSQRHADFNPMRARCSQDCWSLLRLVAHIDQQTAMPAAAPASCSESRGKGPWPPCFCRVCPLTPCLGPAQRPSTAPGPSATCICV
jgi:hypothetical protein